MLKAILKKLAQSVGYRPYIARAFRDARIWSNDELRKFAPLFGGEVVNISAWEDSDKQGGTYSNYFTRASGYHTTNFGTDQGVPQGGDREYFLDLEQALPFHLEKRFDVVYNHTTLEHIYDFRTAFGNMCSISRDVVIIVVPWLQVLHANYGDYWRFSPQAMVRLFEDNGMSTIYLSWTERPRSSVYVFAIASRHPDKWRDIVGHPIDPKAPGFLEASGDAAGRYAV